MPLFLSETSLKPTLKFPPNTQISSTKKEKARWPLNCIPFEIDQFSELLFFSHYSSFNNIEFFEFHFLKKKKILNNKRNENRHFQVKFCDSFYEVSIKNFFFIWHKIFSEWSAELFTTNFSIIFISNVNT